MPSESLPLNGPVDTASYLTQSRPALVRFFRRRCGNLPQAEDLAQEVILRLLDRSEWSTLDEAKGYIFRTAANLWADQQRRHGVRRGSEVRWDERLVQGVAEGIVPERVVLGDKLRREDKLQETRFAAASRKVERVWEGLGEHVNRPEFLALRAQALTRARRANRRRWALPWTDLQRAWIVAAGFVGAAVIAGLAWQLSPYGFRTGVYETDVGEQRVIELADHSHIALDTATRIRATLTPAARTVEISRGQAQFSVAHDPARPFKVIAGGHSIVAVGTIFTVDLSDQTLHVAMMEGRVAVLTPGVAPGAIELSAGEALRFSRAGAATVTPKADIVAAAAWREGKVIFHSEPLAEAVRRLNRYSRVRLEVEGADLSNLSVSGVFETGDSRAFADAVQAYLPVFLVGGAISG